MNANGIIIDFCIIVVTYLHVMAGEQISFHMWFSWLSPTQMRVCEWGASLFFNHHSDITFFSCTSPVGFLWNHGEKRKKPLDIFNVCSLWYSVLSSLHILNCNWGWEKRLPLQVWQDRAVASLHAASKTRIRSLHGCSAICCQNAGLSVS